MVFCLLNLVFPTDDNFSKVDSESILVIYNNLVNFQLFCSQFLVGIILNQNIISERSATYLSTELVPFVSLAIFKSAIKDCVFKEQKNVY